MVAAISMIDYPEIFLASGLVRNEWGDDYARRYIEESQSGLASRRWSIFGAFLEGELVGTAAAIKSDIDYDLWGVTWVVVAPKMRNRGIGRRLLETCESIILLQKHLYPAESVIVELTTRIPEWYERLGYGRIYRLGSGWLMAKTVFGQNASAHGSLDIMGGFPFTDPNCKGCGAPLIVDNAWMADGCPCNTALGVNSMNETRWRLLMLLQQRQAHELEQLRLGFPPRLYAEQEGGSS